MGTKPKARPVRDWAAPARAAKVETSDRIADGVTAGGRPRMVRVARRGESRAIALLSASRREAARRYADAVERVAAPGGCSLTASGGGRPSGEGRQFHAINAVDWLARLEAHISPDSVDLDARGRRITRRDLLRRVAVDGLSLSEVATRAGVKASGSRRARLSAALEEDLAALARLIGLE